MALQQEELMGEKITPRDFDYLMVGFITGISIDSGQTKEELNELSDFIVETEFAKSIGVTGTLKESFNDITV